MPLDKKLGKARINLPSSMSRKSDINREKGEDAAIFMIQLRLTSNLVIVCSYFSHNFPNQKTPCKLLIFLKFTSSNFSKPHHHRVSLSLLGPSICYESLSSPVQTS